VTRAQEAEENYLIKRELATIKQQTDAARAKLEQAESTIRELRHHRHWVRSLLEHVFLPCRSHRDAQLRVCVL
jgi:predicted metal-dependent enzyme (double-stranded beta helix superfamily)